MGVGGVDVEYMSRRLKQGRAQSIGSAHLLGEEDILPLLERLAFFGKIAAEFRGRKALIAGEELADTFSRVRQLASHYSPLKGDGPYVIEELEANPLVVRGRKLVPLDGLCRFSRSHVEDKSRPHENIRYLLRPQTIGIIGVSEKMNIGHTILNNVLKNGFPRDKVFVVKPGLREIEGCACFPAIADLPQTVDLFVLTLAADQSLQVMKELVEGEKARSVIIIAGGLGEKKGTQDIEAGIKKIIQESRDQGRPTPVVNGGNCLGIYSRPGRYDTTFIPELKFPRPKGPDSGLVHISQSGAYMITRMSRLSHIVPLYAVSLGNQIDLTASDYLQYLKNDPEAKMFALYIEGFHAGDGLALAGAASEIAKQKGKAIVAYKAGRTPEGRTATSSHTASVAGDYDVAKAVLEEAGVIVAETIFEFESSLKGMVYLSDKKIRGNRVGLISNAGFECVIMADNLKNDTELTLASLSPATVKKMSRILAPLGIDRIQDVRNPIDITPVGDDAVFCECVRALLEDDNVDCAVVSPVPMTPTMQTLAPGEGYTESIYCPESTPMRLVEIFHGSDKPFVVNVDAGASYQPMVELLEKEGVPTFNRCDDAVKFLRKYINSRLKKSGLTTNLRRVAKE
jgi:acyl-CoA synthetase (NDP forming)